MCEEVLLYLNKNKKTKRRTGSNKNGQNNVNCAEKRPLSRGSDTFGIVRTVPLITRTSRGWTRGRGARQSSTLTLLCNLRDGSNTFR